MSAPEYEIRTVLDFLKVPKERRALCLKEFATFLSVIEPACSLMGHVADQVVDPGAIAFTPINLYHWVDDDRGAFGMSVELPDGTRQNVFDITPDDAAKISDSLDALAAEGTESA